MLLLAEPQERGSQHRIMSQIEGPNRLLRRHLHGARLALRGSWFAELDHTQVQNPPRGNKKFRSAVAGREARAQDFMAIDDRLKRPTQRELVKQPCQSKRERTIVGRTPWFQLAQKPESLLRERKGQ